MGPLAREAADRADAVDERTLVARLVSALGPACPPPPRGPGSDCAARATSGDRAYRILSVDGVLLGRHFDLSAPAEAVGHKLVHRNLSDLAAAGAAPSDALLTIVAGGDISLAWLEAFARGVGAAAAKTELEVSGGDVARGPDGHLAAHLAVTGFAHRVLARQGARPGDILMVTGALGGSRLGHHLGFEARLAEGEWLCGQAAVSACTDLSDGLAADLPGLLGPLGATVDLDATPVAEAARRLARSDGVPAAEHAWLDGEDHELLFAADPALADWLAASFRTTFPGTPLATLGAVETEPGLREARGRPLPRGGFSHFAPG
jgi:thiamine-monophosphate kinase